jgi:hypothetical protein
MKPNPKDKKIAAAVEMIGRMGGKQFEIRFFEEQDDDVFDPPIWIARAKFQDKGHDVWEATGAMNPWRAIFRLLETLMDGGECTHCGKMTAVDENPPDFAISATEELVCWYRYDPELKTFRRQCEGVKT